MACRKKVAMHLTLKAGVKKKKYKYASSVSRHYFPPGWRGTIHQENKNFLTFLDQKTLFSLDINL